MSYCSSRDVGGVELVADVLRQRVGVDVVLALLERGGELEAQLRQDGGIGLEGDALVGQGRGLADQAA
jgi:hypothetical protein